MRSVSDTEARLERLKKMDQLCDEHNQRPQLDDPFEEMLRTAKTGLEMVRASIGLTDPSKICLHFMKIHTEMLSDQVDDQRDDKKMYDTLRGLFAVTFGIGYHLGRETKDDCSIGEQSHPSKDSPHD